MRTRLLLLFGGALVLTACFHADLQDGVIACGAEQACPPGMACGADGLCYRDPGAPADDPGLADAGPQDAAVGKDHPDTGATFRSCRERHPTSLFCDDFEAGEPVGWSGLSTRNAESRTVPGGVLGGSAALELRGASPSSNVHHQYRFDTPVADGTLHLRAYYFVPSGFVIDHWLVLNSMLPDFGRAGDKISVDLNRGDEVSLVNTVDPDRNGYFTGSVFPRDRWVCVELVMTYGGAGAGSAQVRLDGDLLLATPAGDDTAAGGAYEGIWVGFSSSSSNPEPPVVRLDEVVVARGPIGCE